LKFFPLCSFKLLDTLLNDITELIYKHFYDVPGKTQDLTVLLNVAVLNSTEPNCAISFLETHYTQGTKNKYQPYW